MARCGCSGSAVCNCLVQAGDNVTVTGTGQVGNPYVVSSATNPVTVTDTPTVDLTLTGQNISAAVNVDPVAGNLVHVTAQGLRVDCTDVQGCLDGALLVNAPLSLTGAGTSADPWVISDAGAAAAITTASTDSVLLSPGTAPLTANVRVSADPSNLLETVPGNGLDVTLHHGCGLVGQGTVANPLFVDTNGSVWPWPCPISNTNAGRIYCEPVSGGLYVDPEKFTFVQHLIQPVVGGSNGTPQPLADFIRPADGGTGNLDNFPVDNVLHPLGVTGDLVITNPSPCRPMQLEVEYGLSHYALRVDGPGRTNVQVTAALSAAGAGGVAFGTQIGNAHNQNFSANPDNGDDILWDTGTTYPLNLAPALLVLNPGSSVTFTITAQMKVPNFAANGQNSSLTMESFVRVFGWSL